MKKTEDRILKLEINGMVEMLVVVISSLILHPSSFAQGPLTPPGPPGPTFKTLQQVEPRTPITNLPYIITLPGSYYFVTNFTGAAGSTGIVVQADNVTIDLNGFALVGGGGATGPGILVSTPQKNLSIRNGIVRGWGERGVNAFLASNCHVERMLFSDNGLTAIRAGMVVGSNSVVIGCASLGNGENGMLVDGGSTVKDCVASRNGGSGIFAGLGSTVSGCTASSNGEDGIFANDGSTVSGCTAQSNGLNGIDAGGGSTVSGCTTRSNTENGIIAGSSSTVSGCAAYANTGDGINANSGCTVSGCTAQGNGNDGINVGFGFGSTVSGCTARSNGGDGIEVFAACHVFNNMCSNNGPAASDGAGINATADGNRIDNNLVTGNDRGIDCNPATGNLVTRNSARGNTINFDIVAGNNSAVIIATPGVAFSSTEAWANFGF